MTLVLGLLFKEKAYCYKANEMTEMVRTPETMYLFFKVFFYICICHVIAFLVFRMDPGTSLAMDSKRQFPLSIPRYNMGGCRG